MKDLAQLNFHHLFYFWRVASIGHLTRAAEELHTSQSALSAQIRQLEERIGVRLLTRTTRSVSPTEAGEQLLQHVAPRLEEIASDIAAVREYREQERRDKADTAIVQAARRRARAQLRKGK